MSTFLILGHHEKPRVALFQNTPNRMVFSSFSEMIKSYIGANHRFQFVNQFPHDFCQFPYFPRRCLGPNPYPLHAPAVPRSMPAAIKGSSTSTAEPMTSAATEPRLFECHIPWLCQNSYWKWPFIVSFSMKNGGSFHSYVSLPEGIPCESEIFPPSLWFFPWNSEIFGRFGG